MTTLDRVSRGDPETRRRILDAARTLIDAEPGATVSMSQVAAAAGVSRQAIYLHFPDRVALFLELSRMIDAAERTPQRQRRVDDAPSGRAMLREAVALQAFLKPRLHGLAVTMDVLRRTDTAADAAWREREHARLGRVEVVVQRLADEGALSDQWDVPTATRLMWAITSQRVWDDLANDQGWSKTQYTEAITALLERALLQPVVRPTHETPAPKAPRTRASK